ncbi:MAG: hypothetical protein PW788_04350 [Micavibrio sp.]|nr:hypothetical protein [Micavibrio sp.]
MTDVIKGKDRLIGSEADALSLYGTAPEKYHGKVGLEVEMPLFKPGATRPQIPTANEMLQMHASLKAKGFDAQLEASGVLEYASPPVNVADAGKLAQIARKEMQAFEAEAEKHGYARAPFCILPTTSLDDALKNKVPRERLETSLAVIREAFHEDITQIPLLTTGVQTSFSPKNADEMFRMAVRGYAVTPLIIAAMNSSAGFSCNDNDRKDYHLRGKYYDLYGTSGGISPAFLKSSNAGEMIKNHISQVFDAPMYFAYDAEGSLMKSTKDNILTFRKLAAQGLNTQTNYELAESFLYNDIKICNLRDEAGAVVGKRIEVRAADSGLHQPASTLLLTAAVVPDGKTADAFDRLLKDYGFTGNPKLDGPLLQEARDAAINHGGRFMDVKFGTGSLREFAADVASLVEAHYSRDKTVAPDVAKLCDVLLTGDCDAKVFAQTFPTLQSVANDLQRSANVKPATAPQRKLAR